MKHVEVFQATGFLVWIRAEMFVQPVQALRPGGLDGVNVTILCSAGGNYWMLAEAE